MRISDWSSDVCSSDLIEKLSIKLLSNDKGIGVFLDNGLDKRRCKVRKVLASVALSDVSVRPKNNVFEQTHRSRCSRHDTSRMLTETQTKHRSEEPSCRERVFKYW